MSSQTMITPELSAKRPLPGGTIPSNLAFSPDDRILSYLLPGSDCPAMRLMGIDVEGLLSDFSRGEGKCDTIGMNSSQAAASPPLAVTPKCMFSPSTKNDEKEVISHKEQMQRERKRLTSSGVTSYSWSSPSTKCHGEPSSSPPLPARLVVPLSGNIYVQDGCDTSTARMVYKKDSEESVALDVQLSPDGSMVAFVMRDEIFVCSVNPAQELEGSHCTQLTFGACDGVTNGVADYIAQEEMNRYLGFWWSPNSRSIVFAHVDERDVTVFTIPQFSASNTKAEPIRYPFAGKKNCITKLGVVSVDAERVKKQEGGQLNHTDYNPVWLDISTSFNDHVNGSAYIARVGWLPDGSVYAQVQNRNQMQLQLLRLDIVTGHQTLLLEENNTVWVNIHDLIWCIPNLGSLYRTGKSSISTTMMQQNKDDLHSGHEDSKSTGNSQSIHFLWGSERSGFMQLYLYEFNPDSKEKEGGTLVHPDPLGGANWVVDSIVGVDTTKGIVYVMGTFNSPCEKHLYSMSYLDTSQPVKCLTEGVGMHNVVMNHAHTVLVDLFSSLERPPITSIYVLSEVPGAMPIRILDIHNALDDCTKDLGGINLRPPEIFTVKTRDQVPDLFTAVYRPDPLEYGIGPYPTVVSVYGGPTIQVVTRRWGMTADMRAQSLRALGFLVVKCDNRGSGRRGLEFESWIKHRVGDIEAQDQEDVVKYLVEKKLADPERVGIYGWSYGGYLSAMCLLRAPETFSVGICGGLVSTWDAYCTHYTERYMGHPDENRDGYYESSLLTHASKLQGKLLLVHGLIDENVHFRHTACFISSLIEAKKPYDLQVFPNDRHGVTWQQSGVYLEQIYINYLIRHLKPSCASADSK
eukprot:87950_1